MKKIILFFLACFTAVSLLAQMNPIHVSGYVTDSISGTPVANFPVHIDIDSAGGFIYHHEVRTMLNGLYADTIFFNNGIVPAGTMRVTALDCMLHPHFADFAFGPGNQNFTKDFVICTGPPPLPCHADFYPAFAPPPPLSVHFINTSVGVNGPWLWSFGDGITSTLFTPVHTYASPGIYQVTLKMGDSLGGGCFDSRTHEIHIGDSTGGGCHAGFTWHCDSNAAMKTVHFTDLSVGGGSTWHWSFGDSTFSADQNPVHTYASNGTYHVCLTITHTNPACQDVACWEVQIGPPPPPPCASWFTHMPNWLHLSFEGHMPFDQPATYTWSFGDGTFGAGKNVDHVYAAPGWYAVTLSTIRQDSSQCAWTSLQQILVGDSNNIHQVYGQVFAGNIPMNHGLVMIFSVDTSLVNPPFVASCFLNPFGAYTFPYVPGGDYVIWALPFDSVGGYLPTYFGDVFHWQQATVIHLGQSQNPYNINLVHSMLLLSGQGVINGQINKTGLKSGTVELATMLLTNEQGETIGYRRVSASGNFNFSGLAYGTYFLKPELPNTTSDLVKVVLSAASPVASVTMTHTGYSILGIGETSIVASFTIYPNPVKDLLNLSITVLSAVDGIAEICNLNDQVVVRQPFKLTRGENQVQMDLSQLAHGMYLLRITSPDGIRIVQKLVK